MIYDYINMIKQQPISEYIFYEYKKVNKMEFEFKEEENI